MKLGAGPDGAWHASAMTSTVDEYLSALPPDQQDALERVRRIILEAVPEATERISYKIPVFAAGGDLVGLAAQAKHLAFYTMSPGLVASMGDQLAGCKVSGASTIHFTPDRPLAKKLIHKIVRARLRENRERER